MADHVASSPGMGSLPKDDPFIGEQQSLFSGGPSDPREPEPNVAPPGKSAAVVEEPEVTPAAKSEADLLRERVEAQDRMIERMLAGQGQGPAASPAVPAAPTILPPGPPPDAVTKPVEFAQWLDKKLSYERQLSEAALVERDRRSDAASTLDRLWSTFQREYPEQSDDEDLVAAAFQKVVQRNGGAMPTDSKVLFKSVSDQVDAWRGGKPKRDHAGRTNGLSPGVQRKGTPRQVPDEEKPQRFADQLADIQLKTGFF